MRDKSRRVSITFNSLARRQATQISFFAFYFEVFAFYILVPRAQMFLNHVFLWNVLWCLISDDKAPPVERTPVYEELERIWKEMVVVKSRQYLSIFREELRATTKIESSSNLIRSHVTSALYRLGFYPSR